MKHTVRRVCYSACELTGEGPISFVLVETNTNVVQLPHKTVEQTKDRISARQNRQEDRQRLTDGRTDE